MSEKAVESVSEKTCGTCRWGHFTMTNHKPPRVNAKQHGLCEWPEPRRLPVPICIERAMSKYADGILHFRQVIWSKDTDCPVWEARNG